MRLTLIALALTLSPAFGQTPPVALSGTTPTTVPGTDVTIQLTGLTDQRCPADVACVWEGMIRLELAVTAGDNRPEPVILCNTCPDGGRKAVVSGYTLALREVFPSTADIARLGRPAEMTDYTFTLDVGVE